MSFETDLALARMVADAVLYEGYLLYPYRASAAKNQSRWQFGVLGPQGAAQAGVGEQPALVSECLVRHQRGATLTVRLRFLQLQARCLETGDDTGGFTAVPELIVDGQRLLSWDEAVEHELQVATVMLVGEGGASEHPVAVDGGSEVTELSPGDSGTPARLVRRRWPLVGRVRLSTVPTPGADGVSRLRVEVENLTESPGAVDKVEAVRRSFLGAHLLLSCQDGEFVSMTDPPAELREAAQACRQERSWPVLVGPPGHDGILLASPIILEDHPTLAGESPGGLFDSTEIDEILTLRILTMTEEEKAEARATDPRAADIIDRSEQLSTDEMSRLHGAMRDPHGPAGGEAPDWPTLGESVQQDPWWDPGTDASVDPATDTVLVAGTSVGRGSLVVLRPSRRADAQDLFFAGQTARVTGVLFDVDGATHVSVVLVDDPAADLHDWYGRYLYFDPDELEPLGTTAAGPESRREMRS